jgi:TonB-linked SusC/RagA family outer membrane protein
MKINVHRCLRGWPQGISSKLLRVMKLTALLLIGFALHVSAKTFSQTITYSGKRVSLETVFSVIERQTGYVVFYDYQQIKSAKPVTLNVKGESLTLFLERCFQGQPFKFAIEDKTIMITKCLAAPTIVVQPMKSFLPPPPLVEIKGKVLDKDGAAIAGASILIKGTQKGAISDEQGFFSLKVTDKNSVLVISFTGYKTQEIPLKGRTEISTRLELDVKALDDVVIIGYGTQKKISVTAAVASVNNKELLQTPVPNIANALIGRLPGLIAQQTSGDPGADGANLFIRGTATLNNSAPLILVDGVERPLNSISAEEVESVSILKDASATAVYGVRGANGVILVTTKRGVEGKAKVNLTYNYGLQEVTRLPNFLDSYNYALLENEALANEGTPPKYSQVQLDGYKNHTDPYLYPDVDYLKEFIRSGAPQQVFSANVNGGTKIVKYFVNAGYVTQNGIYKHTSEKDLNTDLNYSRFNFRSNVDLNVNKDLLLSVNIAARSETRNGPSIATSDLFGLLMRMPPNNSPLLNPDGTYGAYPGVSDNPLAELSYVGFTKNYINLLEGSFTGSYKLNSLLKGLSIKSMLAFTNQYNQKISRTRSNFPRYPITGIDAQGNYQYGALLGADAPLLSYGQSFISDANNSYRQINFEGSINYASSFGKNNVTALVLYNVSRKTLNQTLTFQWPFSYQGLVGRITYNWDNLYLAEFNMGYNGSEQFPPGNRYGFFPSVSVGWVITNESFMKNIKAVSLLKLRGSYGQVGNDQQGTNRFLYLNNPYTTGGGYAFGLTNNINPGGINEGAFGNKFVQWEKANKSNIGLESEFFNSRLSFNVDVFYEKRSNILTQPGTIPATVGAALPVVNLGVVQNKGYEIKLGYKDKIGQFNYNVSTNLSYAINKVIFKDEPSAKYPWLLKTGQSLGLNYGLQTAGFFKDQADIDGWAKSSYNPGPLGRLQPGDFKYVDKNEDGIIDANDIVALGNPNIPRYIIGFTLSVSYKGFDLNALLQGAGETSYAVTMEAGWEFFNGGKVMDIHLGRWTPATAATATYPRLSSNPAAAQHNYQNNDFWIKDAKYLRLKQAEIGYTLPSSICRIKLNSIRVYLNGANLLTWSSRSLKYLDPEGRNNRAWFYPQQRIFSAGVNINF